MARGAGGGAAVCGFQLPEASERATELRLAEKSGGVRSDAPPAEIAEVIESVGKHLSGERQDFRHVALDLGESAAFSRRVYAAARDIPAGQTRTYGQIARACGKPGAARAVGQALGRNPVALIVPCHRVLAAGGKPGGFSAHGGRDTKAKLLALEG